MPINWPRARVLVPHEDIHGFPPLTRPLTNYVYEMYIMYMQYMQSVKIARFPSIVHIIKKSRPRRNNVHLKTMGNERDFFARSEEKSVL